MRAAIFSFHIKKQSTSSDKAHLIRFGIKGSFDVAPAMPSPPPGAALSGLVCFRVRAANSFLPFSPMPIAQPFVACADCVVFSCNQMRSFRRWSVMALRGHGKIRKRKQRCSFSSVSWQKPLHMGHPCRPCRVVQPMYRAQEGRFSPPLASSIGNASSANPSCLCRPTTGQDTFLNASRQCCGRRRASPVHELIEPHDASALFARFLRHGCRCRRPATIAKKSRSTFSSFEK